MWVVNRHDHVQTDDGEMISLVRKSCVLLHQRKFAAPSHELNIPKKMFILLFNFQKSSECVSWKRRGLIGFQLPHNSPPQHEKRKRANLDTHFPVLPLNNKIVKERIWIDLVTNFWSQALTVIR